jgi:hypothetical protein
VITRKGSFVPGLFANPGLLACAASAVALAVYLLGPIKYREGVGLRTYAFVLACLACFCLGSGVRRVRIRPDEPRWQPAPSTVDRVVRMAAIAGLVGIAIFAFDRIFLSGLDYSRGVTTLRFEQQSSQALSQAAAPHSGSILSNLGQLLTPFSIPAYLLYILRPQDLRRHTRWLAHLSLVSPFVYAWLYGGRSPIALFLAFAGGAMAIRRIQGQRALPGRITFKIFVVVLLALVAFYVSYIFRERDRFVQRSGYGALVTQLERSNDTETAAALRDLPQRGRVAQAVAGDVLYLSYYFSHELPTLNRALTYQGRLGPYYGRYEMYLPSVLVGRVLPGLTAEKQITTEGQSANILGLFSTAWGAMFFDFGRGGALFFAFICGLFARHVYRRALRDGNLAAKLLLAYVIAGIIAIPVVSEFTISNALPTLLAIFVTGHYLSRRRTGVSVSSVQNLVSGTA